MSATFTTEQTLEMANAVRALSMDGVQKANSGHPGLPMGAADVATTLFASQMNFDAGAPSWPDRDRFVLSAGHGSMLIYSLAYLLGFDGMDVEDLKSFRQWGAKTAGHPEYGHAPAVETTTGPLGAGLSNAVGMAMAELHLRARFGEDLVNHYTYVLASDGDLMEGISHESAALAGHLKRHIKWVMRAEVIGECQNTDQAERQQEKQNQRRRDVEKPCDGGPGAALGCGAMALPAPGEQFEGSAIADPIEKGVGERQEQEEDQNWDILRVKERHCPQGDGKTCHDQDQISEDPNVAVPG